MTLNFPFLYQTTKKKEDISRNDILKIYYQNEHENDKNK